MSNILILQALTYYCREHAPPESAPLRAPRTGRRSAWAETKGPKGTCGGSIQPRKMKVRHYVHAVRLQRRKDIMLTQYRCNDERCAQPDMGLCLQVVVVSRDAEFREYVERRWCAEPAQHPARPLFGKQWACDAVAPWPAPSLDPTGVLSRMPQARAEHAPSNRTAKGLVLSACRTRPAHGCKRILCKPTWHLAAPTRFGG